MEILDNIPFELNIDAVFTKLRMDKEGEYAKEVRELVEIVTPIIRPKAIYDVSYIENKNHDKVDIGGITFTSRVLRVNLDEVERVFPYIATCGKELDEAGIPSDDFIKHFWLDAIKEGRQAGSNFDYAGPFTESILMGIVALRTEERLYWDAPNMKATNFADAEQYIIPEYFNGWTL